MIGPTLAVAFVAGLSSFLSPCMLPVLPAFLAQLAGSALGRDFARGDLLLGTSLFVAGFALVFAALGVALNAALSGLAAETMTWLPRAAGGVILILGLQMMGLIRPPALDRSHGLTSRVPRAGRLAPLLFGPSFAVAWTPCVGPVLGSTLALAASRPVSAFPLLLAYAAGLGTPFLLAGLFPSRALGFLRRRGRLAARLHAIFGAGLVGMGVLVFTGRLDLLVSFESLNGVLS